MEQRNRSVVQLELIAVVGFGVGETPTPKNPQPKPCHVIPVVDVRWTDSWCKSGQDYEASPAHSSFGYEATLGYSLLHRRGGGR